MLSLPRVNILTLTEDISKKIPKKSKNNDEFYHVTLFRIIQIYNPYSGLKYQCKYKNLGRFT